MKVLITTAAAPSQTPFSTTEKKAPIGIGFLISVLRNAGHHVSFIDNYLKPINFLETGYLQTNNIDFVGIYANTICYRDTLCMLYKLEWFRQSGRWDGKIIVGGPHATVCLDTIPDFVDYVVQGEGEAAIIDIVEGRVHDRIVKYPRIKNLDELPMPAWDYFVDLPYDWSGNFFPEKPVFPMNTSRGCPFSCKFCSVKSIWGKRYTYFSAERIVSDIEYLIEQYGAKGIYFREDNFTLNRKRLITFCNLLKKKNIKISWACETRVNTLDEEMVKLMSETGACGFYLGVESGSQKVLDFLKKDITVQQTREAFRICHKYRIKTAASVVVGVPTEKKEDTNKTLALLSEIKPTITWFNVFVGIPNSELYQYTLDNKLHEFIDDRGLVYLKGHNERVNAFYGGQWDAHVPVDFSQNPEISVIMSVYNGENYLKEAVLSILNQTYQNFEFIIVDDASTDKTPDILKSFVDQRIKIINNSQNRGLTESLNKAIRSASGNYIARMDADDISLPQRFERQLEFLQNNPGHGLVGSSYYTIDENGRIAGLINVLTDDRELKKGLKNQNWFGHGSVMMQREVVLEKGGYNSEFKYAQDYDLWLRIAEGYKLANIDEPLYCWRVTRSNISSENEAEQRNYAQIAISEANKRDMKKPAIDKTAPMFSVIVPTFNRPKMLEMALNSILSQTYQDFEIIVVNDAGKDVSGLVQKYQDPRIQYLQHKENKGLAATRNTGIKYASGQFIALLDDDDIFYPEHLEIAEKNLSEEHQVIYTDAIRAAYERCGSTYKLLKKNVPYSIDFDRNKLLIGNISPVNCFVFNKNLAFKAGLFDETLSTLEDWDFWIRLSAQIPFKHVAQTTVQVNWRNDGTTMTSLLGSEFRTNRERIYSKYQDEINQIPNKNKIIEEFHQIWTKDWQTRSPLTSIIILTCNQLEYTKKCIDSVFKHTQEPFELILVDNGSTDGTVEYLESEVQGRDTAVRIKIIKNLENNGFAGGNNQGMAAAGGDYIVLMNNDAVVTPGWLERLINCADRKPQIGIVGPCSNYVSGPQLVEDVNYDTQTLERLERFSAEVAEQQAGEDERMLRVVGFCMLIKRAVIDKIGGMDDRYGLGNFEDDDFSLRATIAGFESWIAKDCFIHHFGHRTFIGEKVDLKKSLYKNWAVFKEKWGLPFEMPYGSPYRLDDMQNTRFDPSIHFYALEKGKDIMENPSDDPKSAEDAYRALQANFPNKPSNEIIAALQNLIKSYPKFAVAYNDLGVLYYSAGHKENAQQFYQKAVQLDPNNPVFSKNLADFYCIELGRIEEALQIYVNILRSHPDDTETLMATGQICVALGRTSDAMAFFNRTLEIEPWNDDVRKAIEKLDQQPAAGNVKSQSPEEIYQNIKRNISTFSIDEAIEHFQKLLELYPDFALGHNDLGVLHYNQGHKENALKHYQLAAQLQPENITFRKNLADFLFVEMGKVEEALEIYEDILNMHPQDVETLLITGHICVSLKRFEKARAFYNRVLELEPHNSDAKNNIHALNIQKAEDNLLASELPNNDSISTDEVEPNDLEHHFYAIKKPEIAASIIMDLDGVHNRVKECIKSIQTHTFESHELILVNRGASKGIHKWAQELVENNDNYQIIECGRQTVWAESLNQAIKKAHGEMIILGHNDIVIPKGWLRAFKTCFNLIPNIGVVGPMSNETSGIQQLIYSDEFERVSFESAAEAFYQKNQYRRVLTRKLSDFCLAFHRKLPDKIGYLDDQFVSKEIAVEDFCNRVAWAGYQNLIAADTYVYHYNHHKTKDSASLTTKLCIEDRKKLKAKLNRSEGHSHRNNHSQIAHILTHAKTINDKGDLNQAIEILLGGIGIQPDDDQLYLSLAEILVAAKRYQAAKDTLAEMPSVDNVQHIRKAELLGYAEEGLGNFEAALTQVERVLTTNPSAATALNLKGIVAFRNQDRKSAEQFFREALASDPGYGEPYTNLGILKLAEEKEEAASKLFEKGFILTPFDFDIATNYHSLISQLNDYQRAESLAREASALYPYNQKIKYLLIDCLVQLGKYDEAMAEIEAAIVKFGVEDGILSAALKIRESLGDFEFQEISDHIAVSLCMIVKDEEKYLAPCLASVKPIVDEMIVVDTGSSDETKDIARAFGAKVYDYEWHDDFAEARNFSISKAKGHWIFIMDADEVISPQDYNQFIKIVGKQPKTAVAYSFNTRNYNKLANMIGWTPNDGRYPDEEAVSGWLPSSKVRLFSGKDQIWFEGAVHEMVDPVIKRNGIRVKQCHIPIHHYGRLNKDDVNRKDEVYFEIGKKKLEDMGDDINAIRELAIQATNMGKNEEALNLWEKLLSLNLKPRSVSEIYINMGTIYNRMGNFQYALAAAKKAVENAPDLKEAKYNYAVAELHSGELANALVLLKELLLELPDYLPAQFILAAAYCCSGDKETGLAELNELKATPMGTFLAYSCAELATGLMAAQRYPYALNLLSAAMECEIINAEILNLFADCIRLKEDENTAIHFDRQMGSDSHSYERENLRRY